jgi:phytoene synthase
MHGSDSAFSTFEQKWLAAHPEQAVVAVFLAPARRRAAAAFGCLVHELELASLGAREPEVAAAKLAWWREELIAAHTGTPRHPITQTLFAEPRAATIAIARWIDLVTGAIRQIDAPPPPDFRASCDALDAFYRPVATVEATLLGTVDHPAIAQLWIGSCLLRAAAGIAQAPDRRTWLPLDLLARHGLTRAELGRRAPAANAALRDYFGGVRDLLLQALPADPGLALGTRVRARLDLDRARHAACAADPLAAVARPRPWRALWWAWHEARRGAGDC